MAIALLEPLSAIVGIGIAHLADFTARSLRAASDRPSKDGEGYDRKRRACWCNGNPSALGGTNPREYGRGRWHVTETAERLGCERGTLSRTGGRQVVRAYEHGAGVRGPLGWGTAESLDAGAGELRARAVTQGARLARGHRRSRWSRGFTP